MIQKDHEAKFVLWFFITTLLVDYQEINLVKNYEFRFVVFLNLTERVVVDFFIE